MMMTEPKSGAAIKRNGTIHLRAAVTQWRIVSAKAKAGQGKRRCFIWQSDCATQRIPPRAPDAQPVHRRNFLRAEQERERANHCSEADRPELLTFQTSKLTPLTSASFLPVKNRGHMGEL